MADALRTTYCVVQIGSKLARFACGTKRSVLAAAPCEMAGVASPPVAARAPAPAVTLKNVLRSMKPLSRLTHRPPKAAPVCHFLRRIACAAREGKPAPPTPAHSPG